MTEREAQRLHKYLAAMGVASRRAAEQLIAEGRVQVNDETVSQPGVRITPGRDRVAVDGRLLQADPKLRYILLHKPTGYISTVSDERGRRTVLDLLAGVTERVYPVGRLDYNTSGLLLLTNDGELTNRLLHPSREVEKTYLAQVEGDPDQQALERLRRGVRLGDGMTAPAKVRRGRTRDGRFWLELTIHEGRNRQVRRMLEAVGYPVQHLKRTKLAFLDLEGLSPGQWRELTAAEVRQLKSI